MPALVETSLLVVTSHPSSAKISRAASRIRCLVSVEFDAGGRPRRRWAEGAMSTTLSCSEDSSYYPANFLFASGRLRLGHQPVHPAVEVVERRFVAAEHELLGRA